MIVLLFICLFSKQLNVCFIFYVHIVQLETEKVYR